MCFKQQLVIADLIADRQNVPIFVPSPEENPQVIVIHFLINTIEQVIQNQNEATQEINNENEDVVPQVQIVSVRSISENEFYQNT